MEIGSISPPRDPWTDGDPDWRTPTSTTWTVQPAAGVTLCAFPNPLSESTRFLFQASESASSGRVLVYSVAGRLVAQVPISPADYVSGAENGGYVVEWDGRDSHGDELANGVYLYRVEMEAGSQQLRSDMQRLVVMR